MMRVWKAPVFLAMGAALVCLAGVASARAQAGQEPAAHLVTDKFFRNIQVL